MLKFMMLLIAFSGCALTDDGQGDYPVTTPTFPAISAPNTPAGCSNHLSVVTNHAETLTVHITCVRPSDAGDGVVFLMNPVTGVFRTPLSTGLMCGNNVLVFLSDENLIAHEIVNEKLDLICE